MEIEIKLGNRTYIFYSEAAVDIAKSIYNAGSPNDELEEVLENLGIDFCYAL